MTADEVFEQYKIMPVLRLHQLRVAAVGKKIADSFSVPLDTRAILLACLFHDMGNIIKFDLGYLPGSCEPEGLPYWEKVKAEFIRRYGPDEHHATVAIGHELHLPLQVMKYMENIGFSKIALIVATPSYEQKIVQYADMRVAPYGTCSLEERLRDGRKRYLARKARPATAKAVTGSSAEFETLIAYGHELEAQIFAKTDIKPKDITEASVKATIDELRHFQVG